MDSLVCLNCGNGLRHHPAERCLVCGNEIFLREDHVKTIENHRALISQVEIHMNNPHWMIDWEIDFPRSPKREVLAKLGEQILALEVQMTSTCTGCGGEIIEEALDYGFLIHVPENGLCAFELDACRLGEEE